MKKKMKKSVYTTPIITRIILDPAQAILQQCKVGGAYFNTTAAKCMYVTTGTGPITSTFCLVSVRGNNAVTPAYSWNWAVDQTDAQPS